MVYSKISVLRGVVFDSRDLSDAVLGEVFSRKGGRVRARGTCEWPPVPRRGAWKGVRRGSQDRPPPASVSQSSGSLETAAPGVRGLVGSPEEEEGREATQTPSVEGLGT